MAVNRRFGVAGVADSRGAFAMCLDQRSHELCEGPAPAAGFQQPRLGYGNIRKARADGLGKRDRFGMAASPLHDDRARPGVRIAQPMPQLEPQRLLRFPKTDMCRDIAGNNQHSDELAVTFERRYADAPPPFVALPIRP